MKRLSFTLITAGLLMGWLLSLNQFAPAQYNNGELPTLEFLGEGEATYNEPGWNFIVKRLKPYRLIFVPGPTYTAAKDERVWRSMGTDGAPPAVYHDDIEIGLVEEDCIIQYLSIDDDIDDRINHFRLDGEILFSIPQGMVSKGEIVVPRAGFLSYDANDSIGMYLTVCEQFMTPEPTLTLEPTSTGTVTATIQPTETPIISGTVTVTPTLEMTETAVPTETPDTTQTPPALQTVTAEPPITPTPTLPVATRRPTRTPLQACLRINFEVSGDEAREGRFDVVEVGGRLLTSWEAKEGWQDSGWIYKIDTTFDEVHVDVYFVPADGGPTVQMKMWNPAPGTPHGWVSQQRCHALEVGWP